MLITPEQIKGLGQGERELLLSVVSMRETGASEQSQFSFDVPFILEVMGETREILRTEVLKDRTVKEEYKFYNFYNSGEYVIKVFVNCPIATKIEVAIARGPLSRPPLSGEVLSKVSGIGSVELILQPFELSDGKSIKDTFVVSVRLFANTEFDIFWTNKRDFNFFELTPGHLSSMHVKRDIPLYLGFTHSESDAKEPKRSLTFSFNGDSETFIYVSTSDIGQLIPPTANSFTWKATIPKLGGVAIIEIEPDDPNYC